jgi:hypothetical protein
MMDSRTKHRSGTTLTQTANKMNIDSITDAHEILSTSTEADEISEAIDYVADQQGLQDNGGPSLDARHAYFKVGYLIQSLAWSNAHVTDRVKALRAKCNEH